jgi:hypothetical protein
MSIRPLFLIIATMLLSVAATAPTWSDQPLDTAAISSALGRSGKLMPGDVYRVALSRSDLHVTIDGLTLRPGFALGGYAVYKAEPQGTLLLGDLPLSPAEVQAVQESLESSGFRITALHNHLLNETPHVMYMHYMKVGDAAALSADLERALALTKIPPPAAASATPALAADFASEDVIEQILGYKRTVTGGVLSIGVPRAETITLEGMTLPPSMGVATAMNFEPADGGRVATTGDFVLIAKEVPLVESSLKAHGFLATALHQHMLGDSPTLYYMHFYAVGTPESIAAGLKDALSYVNVKS